MSRITRIAAIENATAIWEYDLTLPGNRVLGGSLDVITAIRTIAIKVSSDHFDCVSVYLFIISLYQMQVSGQRIEHFEKLQIQCKINDPLRIPLHSNIWWGSAHNMLDRAYNLCQVELFPWILIIIERLMWCCGTPWQAINLFLQTGDSLYGPITTIRLNGRITKKIRWSAFNLTDRDWERVKDARDILKVGHGCTD